MKLCGFTDVDWARSPSAQKSTRGGIFSVGSTVVSLYNMKQIYVALNLVEVEYLATNQVAYEAI